MPKIAKPKKYTLGLQTILYDRGDGTKIKEEGGETWTATYKLPDVFHFATAAEGDFYLLANGDKAPGTDADLAVEFASAMPSARAPKF